MCYSLRLAVNISLNCIFTFAIRPPDVFVGGVSFYRDFYPDSSIFLCLLFFVSYNTCGSERINFKLEVIVCWAIYGTAPVWSTEPHCWHTVSGSRIRSSTSKFQLIHCLSITSCYSWQTIIYFCWFEAMEQFPGWHYICVITHCFSPKTENAFISAVISGHYSVACLWLFSPHWS